MHCFSSYYLQVRNVLCCSTDFIYLLLYYASFKMLQIPNIDMLAGARLIVEMDGFEPLRGVRLELLSEGKQVLCVAMSRRLASLYTIQVRCQRAAWY
jgi:hypothetical protein